MISIDVVIVFNFVCYLGEGNTDRKELVSRVISAGDSVLTRLWICVKNDDGCIDEQIDKVLGTQVSAKSLTWSYTNILHALHSRNSAVSMSAKTFPDTI